MNESGFQKLRLRPTHRIGWAQALLGLAVLGWASDCGFSEDLAPTKYQVESVFLLNFAKYVDWPASAFTNDTVPMTIGVIGAGPLGDDLKRTIAGKDVNGRPFVLKYLAADAELRGCQILFISHSEASRVGGILDKAGALPILTVGEDEEFEQDGGIINFVLKNGKVRIEISLSAAKKAGLTISSRLLAVADVVRGRPN
jgi:hypothetical protein